ncbi:hypothetical protein DSECCO2_435730 [anaerobic digester metagenome]
MQVENVAGESFTSRRAAQQQGHLAVSHGLLGKIVVNDQGVLAVVAVELRHGASAVGRDELQGSRFGSGGGDDRGVGQGAVLTQGLDDLGDGGALLADGDVEAVDVAVLLGQDGVDADGGLADLTVADDQFALSAADGGHGVDGLQTRVHGLMNGLTGDDAGSLDFDVTEHIRLDRPETVDGIAQGVDDTAHDRVADGNLEDPARTLDDVAFLDVFGLAEKSDAHGVFFKVQNHAHDVTGELEEFHGHRVFAAVNAGDTVTHRQDHASLAHLDLFLVILDLAFDDLANFFCFDLHSLYSPLLIFSFKICS